jgi:phage terminase large subunit
MDSCTNTINEFGIYVWDPKAAARGEDAPLKDNDHCLDAARYFVMDEVA